MARVAPLVILPYCLRFHRRLGIGLTSPFYRSRPDFVFLFRQPTSCKLFLALWVLCIMPSFYLADSVLTKWVSVDHRLSISFILLPKFLLCLDSYIFLLSSGRNQVKTFERRPTHRC